MKSKLISVAMLATMLATPVSTALADTDVNAVQPTVEAVANGTNTDTKLPDDTKVAYTINVNLVDGSGKTLATIPASVKDSTEKLYRVRSKALYDRYNEYLGKEFSEGQVRYKASEIHQDVQRVLKDGVYVYTDNINVKVEPASTAKPAETPKANTDKKADTAKPAENGKKTDAPKTSEAPKVDTAKKADAPKASEAPKAEDTKKAEDAKQTDQTPKADTTKPADQTPAQKPGDSDRVVYVANNGNANAYWVNKSNMPANTNLDTVREMSEKEAIKLGKHQADAEVLAEKHQADKAQADNAKKDSDTAQTDTAKKDDTAKADDTKKADTAKTDTAKTADSKANATNLPKTNDTASLAMPAFGTALMAIGAFFGFKRKNAE
jgi:chromosome undetermined scaffold_50, whole genome shotgun sequence